MRLIRCSIRDSRNRWLRLLELSQLKSRSDYTPPLCQRTSWRSPTISWDPQSSSESRTKIWPSTVSSNSSLPSNRSPGSIPLLRNSTRTSRFSKPSSTSTRRLMLILSPSNSRRTDSLLKWCTDKPHKKREMKSWRSSEREKSESWSPPICSLEESMSNRFHWSSTTIFLKKRKPTSTESDVLVDSEERESLLTLLLLLMENSCLKSKSSTTPRLKSYHSISPRSMNDLFSRTQTKKNNLFFKK